MIWVGLALVGIAAAIMYMRKKSGQGSTGGGAGNSAPDNISEE